VPPPHLHLHHLAERLQHPQAPVVQAEEAAALLLLHHPDHGQLLEAELPAPQLLQRVQDRELAALARCCRRPEVGVDHLLGVADVARVQGEAPQLHQAPEGLRRSGRLLGGMLLRRGAGCPRLGAAARARLGALPQQLQQALLVHSHALARTEARPMPQTAAQNMPPRASSNSRTLNA
jgi:hypothetical protein